LKIYKDKAMTEELDTIDFGRVEAGTTKEKKVWVHNHIKGYLVEIQVEIIPFRDDIEVLFPKEIDPGDVIPVVLRWSPSLKLEEGLSVKLKIKGLEVFQAPRE